MKTFNVYMICCTIIKSNSVLLCAFLRSQQRKNNAVYAMQQCTKTQKWPVLISILYKQGMHVQT